MVKLLARVTLFVQVDCQGLRALGPQPHVRVQELLQILSLHRWKENWRVQGIPLLSTKCPLVNDSICSNNKPLLK